MSDPREMRRIRGSRSDSDSQLDSQSPAPAKPGIRPAGNGQSHSDLDVLDDSETAEASAGQRGDVVNPAPSPQPRRARVHRDQDADDDVSTEDGLPDDLLPETRRGGTAERRQGGQGRGVQGNQRRSASKSRDGSGPSVSFYDEESLGEDYNVRGERSYGGRELSLQDLFYMIRERCMLGAGVGLLLSSLAAFYLLSKPKIFSAQADIQIDLSEDQVLGQGSGIEKVRGSNVQSYWSLEPEFLSYEEKMRSHAFISMVAEEFDDKEVAGFIEKYVKEFPEYRGQDDDGPAATDREIFGQILPGGLSVFREESSSTFSISFQHLDPGWAAQTSNKFANSLGKFLHRQVNEANNSATDFLLDEVKAARAKFTDSQGALAAFHSKHGRVFQTTEEHTSPGVARVQDLSKQITQYDIQLSQLTVKLEQVDRAEGKIEELLRLGFITEFEELGLIDKELEISKRERNTFIGEGMGDRHPSMIENAINSGVLQRNLKAKVDQAVKKLSNEFSAVNESKAALDGKLKAAREVLVASGQDDGDYLILQSQMEQDRLMLVTLEGRLKETGITSRLDSRGVHVINPAMASAVPISPNRQLVAVASLGLFGICLIGLPLGLGLIDNRLKTVSELESFLQTDCLGMIPLKKGGKTKMGNLALAVALKEDTELMEAFRSIYSGIRLKSDVDYPKKVLITSSVPGEGKSFVATNLAYFFEQQGKSVIIVDGDLRRPTQHKNFGLGNDAGILRWFDSDAPPPASMDDLQHPDLDIQQATDAEVSVLRAGGADRNPTAVIETRRFAGIIESASAYFDVVIIDSPPVGVFPDALFLADYVDECIFVTKHRSVPRQKVKFALNQLQQANDRVLGVIVNQLDGMKSMGGYGYNDYGYGYGYNAKKYEAYYSQEDR
ncbi:MAG: succinoglycan biosynthesis transport protein ExoP [Verrucomicrobiales bacterium]|jgi:succinoglycan biosynthesis transport protein ExoP